MINHFNFKMWKGDTVLVTNDMGRYAFLNKKDFIHLCEDKLDRESASYEKLHNDGFVMENLDIYDDKYVHKLRDMKSYVFQGPVLHIFVVTNQCNLSCVYCQAQHHSSQKKGFMSIETGQKAIDIALESPNRHLSFEFQGGEPLLNFPVIREMVNYAEERKGNKSIEYTVVSNLTLMTEEMADFFADHKVSVCTSLDGPKPLQENNRICRNGSSSYEATMDGLMKLRSCGFRPGAIQTTTRLSFAYAKEIVHEYLRQGMEGIFIRPLTPLGFASEDWQRIGYSPEEFLAFYRECFEEILETNRHGHMFKEHHAVIFLEKILEGFSRNYMELRSPCGAGVGQLAYYYDGNVYTCDEARMVAEAGNKMFCLGNVYEDSLKDMISSKTCAVTCTASILESLPGCSDCVYQPYCGTCPVINLATSGNIFPVEAESYRCKIYKGILDYLFELIEEGYEENMKILHAWIGADET